MTTFALVTTLVSLVILGGFTAYSVWRFGWRGSYSSYAAKWAEAVPLESNTNVWSIVTIVAAILICFALLERGEGDPLQFLGFFSPLYLAVVAFTPKYEEKRKQRIIHISGAVLCAAVSLVWLIAIRNAWWAILITAIGALAAAYFTGTIKKSYIFWLEMAMFGAVYAAVII